MVVSANDLPICSCFVLLASLDKVVEDATGRGVTTFKAPWLKPGNREEGEVMGGEVNGPKANLLSRVVPVFRGSSANIATLGL